MKKVFISSVIRGFTAERAAAKEAVELLRHQAVQAEQFGARNHSSQAACLDGVRTSDVYIGIFGERYGDRVASGLSPTEEEFREAEKRGMEILCFVTHGTRDPGQEEFLGSIGAYENGKLFAFYTDPQSLKEKIIQGLNDLNSIAASRGMESSEAAEIIASRFDHNRSPSSSLSKPQLQFGIVPNRYQAEFFSAQDLDSNELRNNLIQLALFHTAPAFFNVSDGTEHREGADFLELFQGDGHGEMPCRSISLAASGQLTLSSTISKPSRRNAMRSGFVSGFVIDEELVSAMLKVSLQVAGAFYSGADRFQAETQFWGWGNLCGTASKFLGRIPEPEPTTISMPGNQMPDPLPLIDRPRLLSRSELLNPEAAVTAIMAGVVRAFRINGAYYDASA